MKQFLFWLLVFILFAIMFMLPGCSKAAIIGHQCKWEKCPYKGITDHRNSVVLYVGDDDSVGYLLDMAHLSFPIEEYEGLEEIIK